jgi:uncharacterized repeat protein (TIGR02543 family)
MPSVTDVTVSPSTVSIDKGDSQTFTATLTGSKLEEADRTVTWTVTGGTKAGTAINAEGELTIAEDETAETLTVTATSVLDDSKSGTASVTVTDKQAAYFGTWMYNSYEQQTINSDEIVWLSGTDYVTISGLTWTKTDNPGGSYIEDYPECYKVTGTVTVNNGYKVPKADGSGVYCNVGDVTVLYYYISADKESIMVWEQWTAEMEYYFGPFYNQLNVEYWQVTWDLNGGEWPANDNHEAQVMKKYGKLRGPVSPTKTGYYFGGWYRESSLTNKVSFLYSITEDLTLYAKWVDVTEPSAKFSVTITPASGSGFHTIVRAERQTESGGWTNAYDLPIAGTIDVVPGTYRIYCQYWDCTTVNCMSSGYSNTFSVSTEQTRTITIVGSAISVR